MTVTTRLINVFKGTQPNGASLIQTRTGQQVIREVNGTIVPYKTDKSEYIRKGYEQSDLFYMVVKRIVDKATQAPWGTYKIVDRAAYSKALVLRKELHKPGALEKYKKYIKKALEVYDGDKALSRLLQYPNDIHTLSQHHSLLWTYKLTTGEYYEQWFTASGGLNAGLPVSLECLPSNFMTIRTNRALPLRITGYTLVGAGTAYADFTTKEILHEAYTNLDWTIDGNHLYGMAPFQPMRTRVQRNNESQMQGAQQMKNGGERGVMYLDLPAEIIKDDMHGNFVVDQTNEMKKKFDEVLGGGNRNTGATTFSGYKVGFEKVGLSPSDLNMTELELTDLRMICAALNAPSQLFNDPSNKTYANEAEGSKALVLNAAVPLLTDREQSLNRQLGNYENYSEGDVVISYDLSVYSELEVNRKDQADYLNTAWWLTPNEKREIMGETTLDDENMNKIYVSSSLVPLEEVSTPDVNPIDPNTEDY